MAAIWLRTRSELRARWRATVAIALLAALGGGFVAAAFAGARRTDSAYPRFLRAYGGADLLAGSHVGGESFYDGRELSVEEFDQMDGVIGVEKLRFFLIRNPLAPPASDDAYITVDARSSRRSGEPVDGYKIIEGRAPNPTRADEAVLTLIGAQRKGLRVGARFPLAGVPEVFPDFARGVERKPLEIRIVGLAAVPGDFPPQTGDESVVLHMTPAFYDRYPEQAFGFPGGVVLRLDDRPDALDRFRAAYRAAGGNPAFTIERRLQDANVQRSIELQAIAFLVVASFAALTFVLVFGQVLARQIYLESGDAGSLASLGMTRWQVAGSSVIRAVIAGVGGAVGATGIAYALSPLMPQGSARTAEPAPGFAFDAVALGAVSGGIVLVVVVLSAWPAWRFASRRASDLTRADRPSALAEAAAKLGRLPAMVAGVRLALQRGRGVTAMPVRSTIASVTLGLFALVAATTFASSLQHFLDTPRLYGATWDARVGVERSEVFSGDEYKPGASYDLVSLARRYAESDRTIRGVSVGITGINGVIGRTTIEILAMESAAGDAPMPPLVAGRYPRTLPRGEMQEVVLGKRIFERSGARLGDAIGVVFVDASEDPVRVRVVGVGVVPLFIDTSRLGETALMTPVGVARAVGLPDVNEHIIVDNLFVAGPAEVPAIAKLAGARENADVHIWNDAPPADVVNFGHVQNMPLVLGLLFASFAGATLVHTLVSAIGRRRRDLAILKTIGFVRAQIRRAVMTQALVLTTLALTVGVPLGLIAGRALWAAFAHEHGVVPEAMIHVGGLAAGIVAAFLIVVVIAAVPARAAARTHAAWILRTE